MKKRFSLVHGKRVAAALLSLLLVATTVPFGAFLAMAADLGTVSALTHAENIVIDDDNLETIAVSLDASDDAVRLDKDDQGVWQLALRMTAAESLGNALEQAVYQQKTGTDAWPDDAVSQPFQAPEEADAAALDMTVALDENILQQTDTYTASWRFDWDGNGEFDQEVVFTIDTARIVLMDENEQVYPKYGDVTALGAADALKVETNASGVTTVSGVKCVELQQAAAENAVWSVQLEVAAPYGMDAAALEQAKFSESDGNGGWQPASAFLTESGARTQTLVYDFQKEEVTAGAELGTQWGFDWNGDGDYEQTLVLTLQADLLVLKDAAGKQVWPLLQTKLTLNPTEQGDVSAEVEVEGIGTVRATWSAEEQKLVLKTDSAGYHFVSAKVNGDELVDSESGKGNPIQLETTLDPVTQPITIEVGFAINQYKVTASTVNAEGTAGNAGNVFKANDETIEHGERARFSLTCASGYQAIDVNGIFGEKEKPITVPTDGLLTMQNGAEQDVEAVICFKPIQYEITYVTPIGTAPEKTIYTVETESPIELEAPAAVEGFAFAGWAKLENNCVTGDKLVTNVLPTALETMTLYAVWEVETTIQAAAGETEITSGTWTNAKDIELTISSALPETLQVTYTYSDGKEELTTEETIQQSNESGQTTYTVKKAAFTANDILYQYATEGDGFTLCQDYESPQPTVQLQKDQDNWENFKQILEKITFGLYTYRAKTEVRISALDGYSGVKKVEYLEKAYPNAEYGENNQFAKEDIEKWENWTELSAEEKYTFEIEADNKNVVIFARVTDNAGNVSYACSAGIIVDITPPAGVLKPQGFSTEIVDGDKKKPAYGVNDVLGDNDADKDTITIAVEEREHALQEEGADTSVLQSGIAEVSYEIWTKQRAEDAWELKKGATSLYLREESSADSIATEFTGEIVLTDVSQNYNTNHVRIDLSVKDRAGNTSDVSEEIAVDVTLPQVQVSYDKNQDSRFYNAPRTATFTYTERSENWSYEEAKDALNRLIEAYDINGSEVEGAYTIGEQPVSKLGATPDQDTHTITVSFTGDAAFSIHNSTESGYEGIFACTDAMGNNSGAITYDSKETKNPFQFTVDQAAPTDLQLEYDKQPVGGWIDTLLHALTFGFYDAPTTVTLTAKDVISGVEQLVVTVLPDEENPAATTCLPQLAPGEDEYRFVINQETAEAGACEGYDAWKIELLPDEEDASVYKAEIEIPEEFRGQVTFQAVDYAENAAQYEEGDDKKAAVVDTIAPELSIEYSSEATPVVVSSDGSLLEEAQSKEDTAYYARPVTAKLTFKDANFDIGGTADAKIWVNGEIVEASWGEFDPATQTQIAEIELQADGDYQITVEYADKAGNKPVLANGAKYLYGEDGSYSTNQITVDTTAPELVRYTIAPNAVVSSSEERSYYDAPQTITFTIKEHNFCVGVLQELADRAQFLVPAASDGQQTEFVATDVTEARLAEIETELLDQLRDVENWTHDEGDLHTVTLQVAKDANYAIDFLPLDLAGNKLSEAMPLAFTVDTAAPEILGIAYEENVFGTIISGLTFGYYNAQVEATVTATDDTAGIYRFEYEGLLADGVSERNQAVLQSAISEAEITQLTDTDGNLTNQFSAKFKIPRDVLTELNSFNGTVTVSAYDRAEHGTTFADDERLVVDRIAPTCAVSFNPEIETVNGVSYYDGPITATVQINEANFYAEDVYILVNGARVTPASWTQNGDVWTANVTLEQEGDYVLSVEYTDRSGNAMQTYTSNQKTIDTTAPVIRVDNIRHESANNGETIGFTLTITDRNLDADRIQPQLQVVTRDGDVGNYSFNTRTVSLGAPSISTDANGNTVFTYIVSNLETDGYYTVSCLVRDYAGHEIQELGAQTTAGSTETPEIHFSVNREGSVFWFETEHTNKYAQGTERVLYDALNNAYANDVVTVRLHEVNVDEVDVLDEAEAQTVLTLNDGSQSADITLTEGENYEKNTRVGAGGWYENVYTLSNDNFDHDGYYSVTIITYDRAGNSNVNQSQESGVLRFTLDRTAPIITTNVEQEGAIIDADTFPVEINLTEANPQEITVRLNGTDVVPEDLGDNVYRVSVNSGSEQAVQVFAKDKAGNESEYEITGLTISTNPFVRFYANKPLFWGSVAGTVVVAGLFIFLLVWKRRKKDEEA